MCECASERRLCLCEYVNVLGCVTLFRVVRLCVSVAAAHTVAWLLLLLLLLLLPLSLVRTPMACSVLGVVCADTVARLLMRSEHNAGAGCSGGCCKGSVEVRSAGVCHV